MKLIDESSAEGYLRQTGRIGPEEKVRVYELLGGVSNVVLYVRRERSDDFVLKQAREQLRVPEPWFCSVERIFREADVLRICERVLRPPIDGLGHESAYFTVSTPRILFEDREQYIMAMTSASPDHVVWKQELMTGRSDAGIVAACGHLLGRLHAGTWQDAAVAEQIGDQQVFDQLRIDPYYRHAANVREEFRPALERLIDSLSSHKLSLVHADFSPKNLLVFSDGLMMVDFETGHFGDPAFDVGFFLSHLMLKAFHFAPKHLPYLLQTEAFWPSYEAALMKTAGEAAFRDLVGRGILNFAGCALARLDGKSGIDYLDDEARRDQVRRLCHDVFEEEPSTWKWVVDWTLQELGDG
ncbi:MAG: phosphotransferase [Planctomycetes bacterium]|nr:phosphotransferase [Planctomycetota bacterium]